MFQKLVQMNIPRQASAALIPAAVATLAFSTTIVASKLNEEHHVD
jgi:hypothetical protein